MHRGTSDRRIIDHRDQPWNRTGSFRVASQEDLPLPPELQAMAKEEAERNELLARIYPHLSSLVVSGQVDSRVAGIAAFQHELTAWAGNPGAWRDESPVPREGCTISDKLSLDEVRRLAQLAFGE